jgi:hypothetical protein
VIGAIVLGAASLAYGIGFTTAGAGLGLLVAALALLAATTGLCVGCEIYRIGARLRGIRGGVLDRVDLAQIGALAGDDLVVEFTHPLCTDCRRLERELRTDGRRVVTVDVSRRADLARRYGIAVVPTAVVVDATGRVISRIAG